jgi:exodeoxyribonuclease VII small subunit
VAVKPPSAAADPGSAAGDSASADGVKDLSYEQARDELVRVVNELEQGSSTLEESLALWERGEALAKRCEEWLVGAKARLDAARAAVTE